MKSSINVSLEKNTGFAPAQASFIEFSANNSKSGLSTPTSLSDLGIPTSSDNNLILLITKSTHSLSVLFSVSNPITFAIGLNFSGTCLAFSSSRIRSMMAVLSVVLPICYQNRFRIL